MSAILLLSCEREKALLGFLRVDYRATYEPRSRVNPNLGQYSVRILLENCMVATTLIFHFELSANVAMYVGRDSHRPAES
jgi:hypothetical protein